MVQWCSGNIWSAGTLTSGPCIRAPACVKISAGARVYARRFVRFHDHCNTIVTKTGSAQEPFLKPPSTSVSCFLSSIDYCIIRCNHTQYSSVHLENISIFPDRVDCTFTMKRATWRYMSIQGNRRDGVASERRSVYDERRQRRSLATITGARRWRLSLASDARNHRSVSGCVS